MLILLSVFYFTSFFFSVFFLIQFIKFLQYPTHNKNWINLHKKIPKVEIEKNKIKVKNLRNTKFIKNNEWSHKVKWNEKEYDLENLKNTWITVDNYSYFQSHIVISFKFVNDKNF
jgi:hypothetical protein